MNIKNLLLLSAALFGSILVVNAYEHEWENPTVFERGKEQPHAWFKTSHTKLLNGKWRFHYADDIKDAPTDFYRPGFDDSKWRVCHKSVTHPFFCVFLYILVES